MQENYENSRVWTKTFSLSGDSEASLQKPKLVWSMRKHCGGQPAVVSPQSDPLLWLTTRTALFRTRGKGQTAALKRVGFSLKKRVRFIHHTLTIKRSAALPHEPAHGFMSVLAWMEGAGRTVRDLKPHTLRALMVDSDGLNLKLKLN